MSHFSSTYGILLGMTVALPPSESVPVSHRVIEMHTPGRLGPTVTIAQAIARYGVSRATIQRRLADGAIEGAHKKPSVHGEEWHLPINALDNLFTPLKEPDTEPRPTKHRPTSEDITVLLKLLADMRADLRHERESRRLELTAAREESQEREQMRLYSRESAARLEGELQSAQHHAAKIAEHHREEITLLRTQSEEERLRRETRDREIERLRSLLSKRQLRKLRRLQQE